VSQVNSFIRSNLLALAVIPSFMFWCSRFLGVLFVDKTDRKAYRKEAAYDMLVILGVFLFGQLLLSWVEPISVETTMRALLLSLATGQVRYVLEKLG
jgi:uncharacterized membrane protein